MLQEHNTTEHTVHVSLIELTGLGDNYSQSKHSIILVGGMLVSDMITPRSHD